MHYYSFGREYDVEWSPLTLTVETSRGLIIAENGRYENDLPRYQGEVCEEKGLPRRNRCGILVTNITEA